MEAIVQELQRAVQSGLCLHGCQLPYLAELTGFPAGPRETIRKSLRRMEERRIVLRRHAAGPLY